MMSADACQKKLNCQLSWALPAKRRIIGAYLVVGVDEGVGHNDVFSSRDGEDNDLGNIVWAEGVDAAA